MSTNSITITLGQGMYIDQDGYIYILNIDKDGIEYLQTFYDYIKE